jgi:hypothetical protein
VDYTLAGGRSLNLSLYGGAIDLAFARLALNWKILRETNLSTSFDFEHGTQVGFGLETFNRYGPAMSLSRAITPKLAAGFSYQLYYRASDIEDRNYTVNIASVDVRYRF